MSVQSLPSWKEGVRRFLEEHSSLHHGPATRRDYESVLKHFAETVCPETIESITRDTIEGYQRTRFSTGESPWTTNKAIRYLRTLFNWWVDHELLERNPCDKVKAIKIIKRRDKRDLLAQALKLIQYLRDIDEPWYVDLCLVLLNTGFRLGEALHLYPEDIDLKRGLIHLTSRPEYPIKDREERAVKLNPITQEVLQRRILSAAGGPLFKGKKYKGIPHRTSISTRISEFAQAAGCTITAHSLRAAFARSMAEYVMPAVLASVCGWAKIATAERHYLDLQTMKAPAPAALG